MIELGDKVDVTTSPPPEDLRDNAALLRAADERQPLAWEELIRRYSRLVRATVAAFRLQPADAEDAVQNTWLRVMERMDTIRDPECLGAWLATTANRECLALIRRGRREVPDELAGEQLVAKDGPEVAFLAREVYQAVDTAVGELTRRRARLIHLLFYQPDSSYAEVARATGLPPASIGPTRRRVLRELQETLEQRGFGPQSAGNVSGDLEEEPTEGDRTGSYFLDDLLDKAEQALREKLEPKATNFRSGSTQGTGDTQLDDLLQRADAALCTDFYDHRSNLLLPASRLAPSTSRASHPPNVALSARELEVLQLAALAMDNAQIGRQLAITEHRVKRHLSNVYAKLGAVSRVDAIRRAIAARLIPGVGMDPEGVDVVAGGPTIT